MTPGNVHAVKPVSTAQRAGNAYILRGWIGIFSTGVDALGNEVKKAGVNAMVFQDDQWSSLASSIRRNYREHRDTAEPLVLIGHSYGADDVVRIARELNRDNIRVDLLLTLDPVTPPAVPGNVKRCVNIYQSNGMWDTLPVLRGVPLEAETNAPTELANLNIRTERTDLLEPGLDHFNIEKKQKIHQEILKHILVTCPPRNQWARANANEPVVMTSAVEKSAVEKSSSLDNAAPAGALVKPTYNTTQAQSPHTASLAKPGGSTNGRMAAGAGN